MSDYYFGPCERCGDRTYARALKLSGISAALCIQCQRDYDILALETPHWSSLQQIEAAVNAAIQAGADERAREIAAEADQHNRAFIALATEFLATKITREAPQEANA